MKTLFKRPLMMALAVLLACCGPSVAVAQTYTAHVSYDQPTHRVSITNNDGTITPGAALPDSEIGGYEVRYRPQGGAYLYKVIPFQAVHSTDVELVGAGMHEFSMRTYDTEGQYSAWAVPTFASTDNAPFTSAGNVPKVSSIYVNLTASGGAADPVADCDASPDTCTVAE